jgi:hypothetical protein
MLTEDELNDLVSRSECAKAKEQESSLAMVLMCVPLGLAIAGLILFLASAA